MGPGFRRSAEGPGEPVRHDRFQCRSRSSTSRNRAKKRASETALGRSRGGLTTKIHLLANALGLPLGFVLTGGQTHDCTQALALLGERRPEAVLATIPTPSSAISPNAISRPSFRHAQRAGSNAPSTAPSIASVTASNEHSLTSNSSGDWPHGSINSNKTSTPPSPSPASHDGSDNMSIHPSSSRSC